MAIYTNFGLCSVVALLSLFTLQGISAAGAESGDGGRGLNVPRPKAMGGVGKGKFKPTLKPKRAMKQNPAKPTSGGVTFQTLTNETCESFISNSTLPLMYNYTSLALFLEVVWDSPALTGALKDTLTGLEESELTVLIGALREFFSATGECGRRISNLGQRTFSAAEVEGTGKVVGFSDRFLQGSRCEERRKCREIESCSDSDQLCSAEGTSLVGAVGTFAGAFIGYAVVIAYPGAIFVSSLLGSAVASATVAAGLVLCQTFTQRCTDRSAAQGLTCDTGACCPGENGCKCGNGCCCCGQGLGPVGRFCGCAPCGCAQEGC